MGPQSNSSEKNTSCPTISDIKNYKGSLNGGGAIGFLKDFYVKVWGEYVSYYENDKKLYKIFNKDHDGKDFIIEARVGLLNSMYGTRIEEIVEIVGIIRKAHGKEGLNSEGFTQKCLDSAIREVRKVKEKSKKEKTSTKIREERSFFSKYFHWYNEVNDFPALPIYDKNVRVGALFYQFGNNKECLKKWPEISKGEKEEGKNKSIDYYGSENVRKKLTYEKLCKLIERFISKIGIDLCGSGLAKHRVFICDCERKVSIYRLVDKFLWLTYKRMQLKENIPKEVADAYDALVSRL